MQNEIDIINGCIKKEKHAEDLLYNQFAPIVYAICLRYAANTDDAKDIFQEGFVKVHTQLHTYNQKGSFDGWVKRIFIHTAIDFCRKNKKMIFQTYEDKHDVSDEQNSFDSIDFSIEKLIGLINKLPDGYRLVFNLYAIEKFSHREIAEMLSITESTSKTQLFKARKLLQKEITALKKYTTNRHER
jgi:RNA polymerase sigma-70 factor (ECF subfamily)